MFLVTNTTNREIHISDLGVTLSPFSMRDLDLIKDQNKIDNSKDLKLSIKSGIIILTKSDRNEKKEPVIENIQNTNNLDINALFSGIKELIKDELKNNNLDNNVLLQEIKKMQTKTSDNSSDNIEIDENMLNKIHEKTISKMRSGVSENSIKIEGKKEINNIGDTEELEGLI